MCFKELQHMDIKYSIAFLQPCELFKIAIYTIFNMINAISDFNNIYIYFPDEF